MPYLNRYWVSLICFCLAIALGCRKEDRLTKSSSAKLSFSTDTISFDTIFTSVESTTRQIKVYNTNSSAIRISEIKLAGGPASPYQLNINGIAANSASNVEIRGHDSLNIFIRISIAPSLVSSTFLIKDAIAFSTNGNNQMVSLKAYGQNVHLLKDAVFSQNAVLDNKIPYVIYNTLKIGINSTVTIPSNCRLYFHKDSKLVVDGTLQIEGTPKDSVVFSSDRLERIYQDEPGQWQGVHFTASSRGNKINYAVIKNALIGIQADSLPPKGDIKLLIANSIVKNMQISAFIGYRTSLIAFNNLFYNCGQYLIYGAYGGEFNLKQNTFANYSNSFARQTSSLYFTDILPGTTKIALLSADISNNIIWGSLSDELIFDKKGATALNVSLQNNLIRTKNNAFAINGNILNADPIFVSQRNDNYMLAPASPGNNKGLNLNLDFYYSLYLKTDKLGKTRLFPSELGCYEN